MQYFRTFGKLIQRPIRTYLSKNTHIPKFYFSTGDANPFGSFLDPKPQRESILDEELKELGLIEDYKHGIRCTIDKKYDIAEDYLNKALDYLKSDEREFKPKLLVHVLNKLSIVLHLQGKEDALTNVMEDLYFLCSAEASQSYNNTFKAFANLMIHYGNTNPKRGVVFAETVLEQHKTEPIPFQYLQDFYFFIGTIYMIAADYKKGIDFLEESIAMKPSPVIRGMALHNVAMGYWWDYCETLNKERANAQKELEQQFQNIETANDEEFKATMAKLESKNKMIIPKLKQAIKSFELLYGDDPVKFPRKEQDKLTPRQFAALSALLNEETHNASPSKWKLEDIVLKSPNTGLSALGLGEMFYHIGFMEQAMFWTKVSLDLSVKTFSMPRNLRNMVILAQINVEQNNSQFAEKLFLDCLQYMEGMQIYNKIVCLEAYGYYLGTQNRKYESEEYYKQAYRLKEIIPEWKQRKELLHLPDYQIL